MKSIVPAPSRVLVDYGLPSDLWGLPGEVRDGPPLGHHVVGDARFQRFHHGLTFLCKLPAEHRAFPAPTELSQEETASRLGRFRTVLRPTNLTRRGRRGLLGLFLTDWL